MREAPDTDGSRWTCVVVDDHDDVRALLRAGVERLGDVDVVADVADGAEALDRVRELRPDLLLADVRMPAPDGFDLVRAVVRERLGARVVMVSASMEHEVVGRALREGAAGYVVKDSGCSVLGEAVRTVRSGERYLDPVLVAAGMTLAPPRLVLSEHDPAWATAFEAAAADVRAAMGGEVLRIEHIGSTSVPGLVAKPVIDLLVGLRSVPPSEGAIERMVELGYRSLGEFGLPERAYFSQEHLHAHCYEIGRGQWESHLLFRDYLRGVPVAREEYATAKRELAEAVGWSRDEYVDHKEAVVDRMLADAARWDAAGR